jgi:DNA modification methylase
MQYSEFLKTKLKYFTKVGFDANNLNKNLFDFQKHIVIKALKKGRYAIFAECGLGKTLMQLEIANQVVKKTKKPFLILAPLAVSQQTIEEGIKFDIDINKLNNNYNGEPGIYITNYEQLKNINTDFFGGIALDESSILKNFNGKTKELILSKFYNTPYRFAFTATPSPNDHLELGNHSEFLGVMKSREMVSMFFINDAFNKDKQATKWRLKKHSIDDFWNWVSTWSIMVSNPSDLGFDGSQFNLPALEINELLIKSKKQNNGMLFNNFSVSATEFHKELRKTITERCKKVADIVNSSTSPYVIWVTSNDEEKEILKLIPDALSVSGSHKIEIKEKRLLGFAKKEFRVLITKTKIAQFGLNYQHCPNQIFLSFNFSFEALYQAIRRSWRFGQKNIVNITLVTVDTMGNVVKSIKEKQLKFEKMKKGMLNATQNTKNITLQKSDFKHQKSNNYTLYNADCIEVVRSMPDNCIDFSFFSPPFSALYMFSDNPKDISNNKSYDEFFMHFDYLIPELFRILKEGRLLSIHVMQLTTLKGRDGKLEIIDFRGDVIRAFQKHGFHFHAEVCIWKDPKIAAQRTKNMQLLHATTKKDSTICRMGFADYIITLKKPGDNKEPVNHDSNGLPFDRWCKIAEPVWMDIDAGDVMRVKDAKAEKDEKHMTPTQKEPIKRLLELYTNPNDIVFSPFNGIGTEGVVAINNNRKYIGVELKESYYKLALNNLKNAESLNNQVSLF